MIGILLYGTGNVILLYELEKYVWEGVLQGLQGKFCQVYAAEGSTYEIFAKNSWDFCSFYPRFYGNCTVSLSK
ncbi:MAG: hypothetical protein HFH51_03230 [Lachnospiraceae bacterium]|nr:hypothetical protein [Lachnospiraceae bacterium]